MDCLNDGVCSGSNTCTCSTRWNGLNGEQCVLTLYHPLAIGFAVRRKTAEDIRSKGFKNSKSTLCRSSHGLSITEKNRFLPTH